MSSGEGRSCDAKIEHLLEGIFQAYHYDFRSYARASLRRRIEHALHSFRLPTATALLERILGSREDFSRLLMHLTIQVSSFFRDPSFWHVLREEVAPHLSTYPFLRIWVAGCGAGEEAYSMAILLHEAGLLERAQIYATDIDDRSLQEAREGVYPIDRFQEYSKNYFLSGGRASFSDYYTTAYSRASMSSFLRDRILFSDHSLATDAAFAEVQLISCRNVSIYFDKDLQDRAFRLFEESLCPRGFLGLGTHESLQFSSAARSFEAVAERERVYRLGARPAVGRTSRGRTT